MLKLLALTGGTAKKWYISASEPGHLGVGQNDGDATKLFSLLPSGCF
jgi:hypothetical protein